jgi:site-specific DNA-methyltransferase (adenine-specific)
MKTNLIYNMNFLNNTLPDKCANLIISDPPYFEVKGDFDFIWDSFEDYLKDVKKWAKECKRILADNGTLFWWGDKKKIAYTQIILDKYFNLENSLVWQKTDSMQYQYYSPELARTYNTHNERCLMYSNESESNNLENGLYAENIKIFTPIIEYMKEQKRKIKEYFNFKTDKDFNEYINKLTDTKSVVSRHYFTYSQWIFPTKEIYLKLQTINNEVFKKEYEVFKKEYEVFKKEYEVFKKEYEALRRHFYNPDKYEEVLKTSQQSNKTKHFDHDTKKGENVTEMLILPTTKEGDLVVVPFAGSGTECAMAKKHRRKFIGYEIEEKHVKTATKRCKLQQIAMF